MPSRINNAKYWRDCADEAMAIAEQMTQEDTKRILLGIAHGYAELARLAETRTAGKTSPQGK